VLPPQPNARSPRSHRLTEVTPPYRFSICTLVTRHDEYERMLESCRQAGFGDDCEYLHVDNSEGNAYEAYRAFNLFLQRAQGRYVIVCHQDVELRHDRRADLEQRIAEVEALDPRWALIGNAGCIDLEHRAIWISDGPSGRFYSRGERFPQRVQSLDENFILVRKDANLAVSADLDGFHFYGTDICVLADILGWNAYVVAFHLYHRSAGKVDESFHRLRTRVEQKYRRALRSRHVQTTMTRLYLSGHALGRALFGNAVVRRVVRWSYKLRRRLFRSP
jgi:hypothetical protein